MNLGHSTHLDPGAYIRGTHAVSLGDQVLVHPRAQLVTLHGPLSISDKCIISEKCVLGGPIPSSSSASTDVSTKPPTSTSLNNPGDAEDNDERDPVKTTIGPNVNIHPNSQILAGAIVRDAVLIESHVTVLRGVTIGSHAKICAGVTVDRDVEEWTVVHGNGDVKRRRLRSDPAENEKQQLVETLRLKAMDREREGAVQLFRAGARMATLAAAAKKK